MSSRVTVVGPTHPTKGGIAQHTDALIDHLTAAEIPCVVETWSAQYPAKLYPGQQNVTGTQDVARTSATTHRSLRWFDPISWIRAGRRARKSTTIVLALVVPFQVVALAVIVLVGRSRRRDCTVIVIAHNVLPHEGLPFDRVLVKIMMRLADRVITHTEAQRALARELGARDVVNTPLPPHLSPSGRRNRVGDPTHRRIGFFGLVRDYKGVDDLIAALPMIPGIDLEIHGECWIDAEALMAAARDLGVIDRVALDDRYVPDDELEAVFDTIDALVLPYRSGTASQLVLIAHHLGVPVIATDVGSFPDQIDHDRSGLVCRASDPASLAETIASLYDGDRLDRLRLGAFTVEAPDHLWDPYLAAVLG